MTESEMYEKDPILWAALQACEFAETVPLTSMENAALVVEAWIAMKRMAAFIRRETKTEY